jgi:hypothetical protein
MSIRDTRIFRNWAYENAGGISHSPRGDSGWEGTLNMTNASIFDNVANGTAHTGAMWSVEGIGGGVAVIVAFSVAHTNESDPVPVTTKFNIIDSSIYNNTAVEGAGLWLGFGTTATYDPGTSYDGGEFPCETNVVRSTISSNKATGRPYRNYDGSWSWYESDGGGISTNCKLTLTDGLVAKNTANRAAGLANHFQRKYRHLASNPGFSHAQ